MKKKILMFILLLIVTLIITLIAFIVFNSKDNKKENEVIYEEVKFDDFTISATNIEQNQNECFIQFSIKNITEKNINVGRIKIILNANEEKLELYLNINDEIESNDTYLTSIFTDDNIENITSISYEIID